ncbi:hypothetical protein [Ferribacterium limneticum]|uniref:hypothetical protein n=1 Tax=Ferribacterium limneticum TaxID=76259 RepID=UPI001CF93592|nr:hypothetical protein [Ferribacterium limneticum]UCV29410.1 hypothetical protein KI617_04760 [Ferribacterium limneticum]UCV33329.1 hypothetical protein KI608_04760 [Ferribacterium limneticum]
MNDFRGQPQPTAARIAIVVAAIMRRLNKPVFRMRFDDAIEFRMEGHGADRRPVSHLT